MIIMCKQNAHAQVWEFDAIVATVAFCLVRSRIPPGGGQPAGRASSAAAAAGAAGAAGDAATAADANAEETAPPLKALVSWEGMQPAQLPSFRQLEVAATAQSALKNVVAASQLVGLGRADIPARPSLRVFLFCPSSSALCGVDHHVLSHRLQRHTPPPTAGAEAALRRRRLLRPVPLRIR